MSPNTSTVTPDKVTGAEASPAAANAHPARHVPMSQFALQQGELMLGGHSLSRLAERVGQTPFYAYDRHLVQTRVEQLRHTLPQGVQLHYAVKANPMPALLAQMVHWVDGLDVASAGEMGRALDAGMSAEHISFAGPGKRDAELLQAVAAGVLVHVESARELTVLADCAEQLGCAARVAVRVNPDFELKGAGMRMGGGARQFGVDVEQVPELLRQIGRMGLAFEGFHVFSGSQSLRADAIAEAQRCAYALVSRLSDDAPCAPRRLNLGGGFGVPYFPGERALDLEPIAQALAQIQAQAAAELPSAQVVLELGRYLVAEAGIYVCRVLDRKVSRGQVFLVVDGGLHHHLAASGNFGQVLRKNYPVTVSARGANARERETVSVVGPLCTPLDLLADRMDLPAAEVGDLVVIYQSGAYGASASPQAFLGHPACAEVLV